MNKILVIRFSSLGDIVLTSPTLRALRARFPLAQIDFLVKSQYADLVKFNKNLTSVLEMRTGDWGELQLILNRIQAERYDLIVDLHNSLRSRYIRMLSRAQKVVTVDKRVFARFALVRFKYRMYDSVLSVAERYLETCSDLDIHDDGKGLEVTVPDQTISTVSSLMSKYKPDRNKPVIGFAPSAKHATKRWLPERYIELGATIARTHSARMLIFGGKEDSTYCNDIAQMINMQVGATVAESFAGRFSLIETAAALDYCTAVVCNDTGLMHLAQARGRNLVAIFGSTVKEFGFFPTSANSIVIEATDVACRPCSHIGKAECPLEHFHCMTDIQVERVASALTTFL